MSDEDAEVPWVPKLGEFVRILHDADYRRVPLSRPDYDNECWEGCEGEVFGFDLGARTAIIRRNARYLDVEFPIDDLIPLDHLKRPEGAVDGAWVQIEGGKYDGQLAQIRGWDCGRLHIQRADGPVEAYRPEEVMLLGNPEDEAGVQVSPPWAGLDIARAVQPAAFGVVREYEYEPAVHSFDFFGSRGPDDSEDAEAKPQGDKT